MKFIDESGFRIRTAPGICLLLAGAMLNGCSSMKSAPATSDVQPPAATAEEVSSEPDLEKLARERAAKGESKSRESEGKNTAAAADTSKGPEITAPLNADQKQLAGSLLPDYERALAAMRLGQLDDAYALLGEVQAKAPGFTGPLLNQALIRIRQNKAADALELLKKAQAAGEKNPYVWNLTGYAEKQLGHFKAARAAYEKALELSPNYGKAHFNLAVLSDLYLPDLPYALKHYEAYQALQAQPDPTVAKWIIDLQKRTGVYKPPAKKAVVEEITEEPSPAAENAPAPAAENPATAAGASEAPPSAAPSGDAPATAQPVEGKQP